MAEIPRKPTFPDHVVRRVIQKIQQEVQDNVIPVCTGLYSEEKLVSQLQAIPKPVLVDYDQRVFYQVVQKQGICPVSSCPTCMQEFTNRKKPIMCHFCTKWSCDQCICHRERLHPLDNNPNGKRYHICYDCDGKYLTLQLNHPYVENRILIQTAIIQVSKELEDVQQKLENQRRKIDAIKGQPKRKMNMRVAILKKEDLDVRKNVKKINWEIETEKDKMSKLQQRKLQIQNKLEQQLQKKERKKKEKQEKRIADQKQKQINEQLQMQAKMEREIQQKQKEQAERIQRQEMQRQKERLKILQAQLHKQKEKQKRRQKEKELELEKQKERIRLKQIQTKKQLERQLQQAKQKQIRMKKEMEQKQIERLKQIERQKQIEKKMQIQRKQQRLRQDAQKQRIAKQKQRLREQEERQKQIQRKIQIQRKQEEQRERQRQREKVAEQKQRLRQEAEALARKQLQNAKQNQTLDILDPSSNQPTHDTQHELVQQNSGKNAYLYNQFKNYFTQDIINAQQTSETTSVTKPQQTRMSYQQKQQLFSQFRRSLEEQQVKAAQSTEIEAAKMEIMKEANKKRRNWEDMNKEDQQQPQIISGGQKCKCTIF